MFPLRSLLTLTLLCLLPVPAFSAAELTISLPLGPYWRPGRYVPVQIKAAIAEPGSYWLGLTADQTFEPSPGSITGRGAGRTSVQVTDGRLDAVVPWLVMDRRAARPRLFIETRSEFVHGPELRQLDESERLVGWTTPNEAFARQLLGDRQLIPIQLDPAKPVRGHAAAWEMLDAIILDAPAATHLEPGQIENLAACGVTLAIKTATPPLPEWPWQRVGEYSVLSHPPSGPTTAGYHPAAFTPAQTWEPGWSQAFRQRMLILAGALALPLLALVLWRPPLGWVWVIAYVALVSFGLGKWWNTQVLVQQAAGEVIVLHPKLTQTDAWTYQRATQNRVATLRWNQVTRPIFPSRDLFDSVWMSLNCDTAGRPGEFDIRLPARYQVAFVHRTLVPYAPRSQPQNPVTSPLLPLVREVYLPEGGRILGQLQTTPLSAPAYGFVEIQPWDAVILDRR